jgi:lytic murein transglycosylase
MVVAFAAPVAAQQCQPQRSFEAWLADFREQAALSGMSPAAIGALNGVAYDPEVVRRDRAQGVFTDDFLTFSSRMVAQYRLDQGRSNLAKYSDTFARIERQFGVPGPVLASFWGLETDFGANIGDGRTITSLATLAYDCRRPDVFYRELMSALYLIHRGDLAAAEMRGPWAGELGQVQFLPSRYVEYGVDFDGDSRIDMLTSAADALASAAHYLQNLGWRAGEPWLQEASVTQALPWEQADVAIKLPLAQWAAWGVRLRDGGALPANGPDAALLLPMGRNGPAFLAYPNFDVYLEWNNSLVYSTTAAYFATRLAGAPRVSPGPGATPLSPAEVREVQSLLQRRGYDVGKVDGIIGLKTRAAVKAVQLQLGLPADSYPDAALLTRLRA